jgi:Sulfotransferase domain
MALKIIGAGLGRTGTFSLKNALEQLDYSKCYHMSELIMDTSRLKYWKQLQKEGQTDFAALFEGYQSLTDNPGCIYYKEFFKQYPQAKVILTVRDPEKWYESTLKTIYDTSPRSLGEKLKMIFKVITSSHVRKLAPIFKYADEVIWEGFFEGKFEDKDWAINKFKAHTAEVKNTIPTNQLLIYQVKDGWEPLCKFLNCPVPAEAFPYTNKRKDFAKKIENAMKTGIVDLN